MFAVLPKWVEATKKACALLACERLPGKPASMHVYLYACFGKIALTILAWVQCRNYLADYAPLLKQELHHWEKTGIHNDLLERSRDANVRLTASMAPPAARQLAECGPCISHRLT